MLNVLNSFIDFFWKARKYSDFESILIARLAIITSLFGLTVPAIMYLRIPLYPQRYYFIIGMIWLACLIGLGLIKFTSVTIKHAVLFINIIVNFCIFCFIYSHGSNFSSSTSWLMTPVLVAFFILGRRTGVIFFVINWLSLSVIQFYFVDSFNMIPEHWDKFSWQSNYLNDQMLSFIFNSAIIFIFVWIMDHTNKRTQELLEENQEKERAMLEQSRMAELGEVAGNIAHEVNNPLMVISGNTQVLSKHLESDQALDKEKMRKSLRKIEKTSERITKIIKGLKHYSRDASSDPLENFFLAPLVEEVEEMVIEKCKSCNVQILPAHIRANIEIKSRSAHVFQVLIILLNNAIDEVCESNDSWVSIVLEEGDQKILVSVIDSGVGISVEAESEIFKAFYTTKAQGKGTGLGLSIAKKIMLSLGGDIYYDRSHGDSRFTLVFNRS
jgi:signal transduction histidine kinase